VVAVRVDFAEHDLRRQVKQAGGHWNPRGKVWELRYAEVAALNLQSRIVEQVASDAGCRG
jgi:hypothetical protein